METYLPITDLKDYTAVLHEVDSLDKVYLTENGQSVYAIMSIKAIKEMEEAIANMAITADLRRAVARSEREGWISQEDLEKEFEVYSWDAALPGKERQCYILI